jgi:ribose/xylose/arabinose/galactoside ABC-type transport system permease subunit
MSGEADPKSDAVKAVLPTPPSAGPAPARARPLDAILPTNLPAAAGPLLGLLALLGLFIVILYWRGNLATFLSPANLQGLLHDSTVPAVVALGMLMVIVSGGIDLSVGSVAALVTVVTMQVFRMVDAATGSTAVASVGAIMAGVLTGGVLGLCNGLGVTVLRVTPFVVTLGTLSIARGLAYFFSGRTKVGFPSAIPGWVTALQVAEVRRGLVDPGVWGAALLAVCVALLMSLTVFGRYCYAIGSNELTARLCGVPVNRYKVMVYTLAGLLTGWAGVLVFAQTTSGDPSAQVGLELNVIAAVVIGGASLSGGQGNVLGTLLGVLILGVLDNAVSFCQVPVEVKYILIGGIVVGNTAINQWQRRRSE